MLQKNYYKRQGARMRHTCCIIMPSLITGRITALPSDTTSRTVITGVKRNSLFFLTVHHIFGRMKSGGSLNGKCVRIVIDPFFPCDWYVPLRWKGASLF